MSKVEIALLLIMFACFVSVLIIMVFWAAREDFKNYMRQPEYKFEQPEWHSSKTTTRSWNIDPKIDDPDFDWDKWNGEDKDLPDSAWLDDAGGWGGKQ